MGSRSPALLAVLLATMFLGGRMAPAKNSKPAVDEARRQADLQSIEKLHQAEIAATKAQNVGTLASLWTDDIVALPPMEPPKIGKAVNRAYVKAGLPAMKSMDLVAYNQGWEEVEVAGDFAFEWGYFETEIRFKIGGTIQQRFNVLRVLRRQSDGAWRVHRTIWNEARHPVGSGIKY